MKMGRNPNGKGTIIRCKDNQYNPYKVRLSYKGTDGKIKYKTVASFDNKKDAQLYIDKLYIEQRKGLLSINITFYDCGKASINGLKLSTSRKNVFLGALERLKELHHKPISSLKYNDYQEALNKINATPNMQQIFKTLLKHIESYAMKNDYIYKYYCSDLTIDKNEKKQKKAILFTSDEIKRLWELHNTITDQNKRFIIDFLLVLLYSGTRANELIILKTENIKFNEGYFITGSKTEAGKNRMIPIHSLIKPIIISYYNKKHTVLFENYFTEPKKDVKDRIASIRNVLLKKLKILCKKEKFHIHKLHDTRHTFITRLNNLNVKTVFIDRIVGQTSNSVGLDTYYKITIEQLIENIELLNY